MSVTQIDLDDEALADVMRIAAVHTKKEAVNLAMRDYVERFRRIEALLARASRRKAGTTRAGWPRGTTRRPSGFDLFPGGFLSGLAAATTTGTHRGLELRAAQRAVGSCEPQRAEFCRSARNADEFDQMSRMFGDVYPDVPVPKSVWRWIDSAQHRLARAGAVGALSVVDLLICDTAAARGLVVLHDDADYELAERHLPDIRVRRVVSADD